MYPKIAIEINSKGLKGVGSSPMKATLLQVSTVEQKASIEVFCKIGKDLLTKEQVKQSNRAVTCMKNTGMGIEMSKSCKRIKV